MKRTLQGKQIIILSDDDNENEVKLYDAKVKEIDKKQADSCKQNDVFIEKLKKLKKHECSIFESNVKNYSTNGDDEDEIFEQPLDLSTVQNFSQFTNGRYPSQKSSVPINLEQDKSQEQKNEKKESIQKPKVLKNTQSYYMPLQINRMAKKYDHLTWKWIGNKKQLWISRFRGTKMHFIPAFLDFTIPLQGKHVIRMEITRSQDYRIYFGITTQKAVYLQWTNIIPQPFIAFSFERCCIIQKPFSQNTTMKQIIPNFTKIYNHIEMQVDMQNFLITFSLKKNKKHKVYHQIPQQFIQQAEISDKQQNVKKKLHGLVPFVGLLTDYDQFKFLSER